MKLAEPFESVICASMPEVESVNVTVPVEEAGETVAVRGNADPYARLEAIGASVVVEAASVTSVLSVLLVDGRFSESPP